MQHAAVNVPGTVKDRRVPEQADVTSLSSKERL